MHSGAPEPQPDAAPLFRPEQGAFAVGLATRNQGEAIGALVRIATCISGHVEVMVNCGPQFDYGAAGGTWSYTGDGCVHRERNRHSAAR